MPLCLLGRAVVLQDAADRGFLLAPQVLRSVLLFPTIERMAQSPQGKLMTPLLCKLRYILYMPVYLLSFLPEGVKASLVRFALRGMKTCDESSITTSVNLFSVDCIGECIQLLYCLSCVNVDVVHKCSILKRESIFEDRSNLSSN